MKTMNQTPHVPHDWKPAVFTVAGIVALLAAVAYLMLAFMR